MLLLGLLNISIFLLYSSIFASRIFLASSWIHLWVVVLLLGEWSQPGWGHLWYKLHLGQNIQLLFNLGSFILKYGLSGGKGLLKGDKGPSWFEL